MKIFLELLYYNAHSITYHIPDGSSGLFMKVKLKNLKIMEGLMKEYTVNESIMNKIILFMIEHNKYKIVELPAPKFAWNLKIVDTNLRQKYKITIIAVKKMIEVDGRPQENWNINPLWSDVIEKEDTLIILGAVEDIKNLYPEIDRA